MRERGVERRPCNFSNTPAAWISILSSSFVSCFSNNVMYRARAPRGTAENSVVKQQFLQVGCRKVSRSGECSFARRRLIPVPIPREILTVTGRTDRSGTFIPRTWSLCRILCQIKRRIRNCGNNRRYKLCLSVLLWNMYVYAGFCMQLI